MGNITVGRYMTESPYSISETALVKEAIALMGLRRIRHLPVTRGKQLAGILSDRDLKLILGFVDLEFSPMQVFQICQKDPYIVDAETDLAQVAKTMAERHLGSAIVTDGGVLKGIFTTVDACRALAELAV